MYKQANKVSLMFPQLFHTDTESFSFPLFIKIGKLYKLFDPTNASTVIQAGPQLGGKACFFFMVVNEEHCQYFLISLKCFLSLAKHNRKQVFNFKNWILHLKQIFFCRCSVHVIRCFKANNLNINLDKISQNQKNKNKIEDNSNLKLKLLNYVK